MIGSLWKMIELLEKKQNSLLTTIAVCSLSAAIMLTVGIHKGEARAETTKAGGIQGVTVLKPNTQWADKDSGLHLEGEATADHPSWKFRKAACEVLAMQKLFREKASKAEIEAADMEMLAMTTQLEEFTDSLRTRMHMERDAPSEESKDAISKSVGDSG